MNKILFDSSHTCDERLGIHSISKLQDNLTNTSQKYQFSNSQSFEEKENLHSTQYQLKRQTLFNGWEHSELQLAPYKKQDSVVYELDFERESTQNHIQNENLVGSCNLDMKNFTFSKEKSLTEQPGLGQKSTIVNNNPSEQVVVVENEAAIAAQKEKNSRRQRQEKQLEFIKILRNNVGFTNDIWRKRGFGVLQKAIFFSQRLMSVSITKRFRKMQRRQIDIINDRTSFYDIYRFADYFDSDKPSLTERIYFKYQNWILKKKSAILQRLEDACLGSFLIKFFKLIDLEDLVIRPNSTFKICWDIYILAMVLINVFFVGDGAIASFIVDIAMNFNTSFFKQGVLNNNRRDIIKRYGSNRFLFDIFVVFPYIFNQNPSWKYLQAIFLLRVFLIRDIIQRLEEVFHPRNLGAALIDFIKVMFIISFIAHLSCCSFYLLARVEDEPVTWVTKLNVPSDDVTGIYISGVYFSVITMITLGYGDIVPVTTRERTFVIGMTLVSCAVFAYSINTISGIITDFTSRKMLFRQKMMNLNLHIKKRGLNKELALTVRKYIEYLYKEEMVSNESAEKDLEQIPSALKEDVYQDIYGKLLRQNKVFNLNFTSFFLDKLALKMKEKRYGPEEIIYKQGDEGNTLYFLIKGNVQLFFPIKSQTDTSYLQIQKLHKGSTFGFYSFFSGNNRETSARSLRVTSLVTLSFADFKEVAESFPVDYEKFCMLRDQVKFSNLTKGLDVRCKSCDNFTHQLFECPFLKYKPQKTILIAKFNKSDPMERKQQERRIIRSPNSLFLLQFISKDDIQCILGIEETDSDQERYEQEEEEAVDLEEQFRDDKRTSYAIFEEKDLNDPTKLKEKDKERDKESQHYIESQQNKRQSSFHRLESTLSYKRKILNSQHSTASNIAKQASKLNSRMSIRSNKILLPEKTVNQPIVEFMSIELDRVKTYQNYLPQNNIDPVLSQYNQSLMMQKVYRPKKQFYQIINKNRQKINLSKLRVMSAMKKINKNQSFIPKNNKIENSQRKKIIQEQLKLYTEGNSDYLSQRSPNESNQNMEISNHEDVNKEDLYHEPIKYDIKVLVQTKSSDYLDKKEVEEPTIQNINNKNVLVVENILRDHPTDEHQEEKEDNEEKEQQDMVRLHIKKKKTNSFILKPSQFFQENQQEEQEHEHNTRESKRKRSYQLLHTAILDYNKKRRSNSNILTQDRSSHQIGSALENEEDPKEIKTIEKKTSIV